MSGVECSVSESTKLRVLVQLSFVKRALDSLVMCNKSRRRCVDTVYSIMQARLKQVRGDVLFLQPRGVAKCNFAWGHFIRSMVKSRSTVKSRSKSKVGQRSEVGQRPKVGKGLNVDQRPEVGQLPEVGQRSKVGTVKNRLEVKSRSKVWSRSEICQSSWGLHIFAKICIISYNLHKLA